MRNAITYILGLILGYLSCVFILWLACKLIGNPFSISGSVIVFLLTFTGSTIVRNTAKHLESVKRK